MPFGRGVKNVAGTTVEVVQGRALGKSNSDAAYS
jgi:hypothetical protein